MRPFIIFRWLFITIFTILFLLIFFNKNNKSFIILFAVAASLYFIIVFCGAYFIQLNFFVKAFNHGTPRTNQLALTFDDGPHENTEKILQILNDFNVKATFFIIGKNIEGKQDIIKKTIDQGHIIANHSFAHNNMYSMKKVQDMQADIEKNNQLLSEIAGKQIRWFRPPYGVTNPKVAKALSTLPLDVIGWNVRSLDTTIKDPTKVVERIISKLKGGDIVLLHDSITKTAQVLEAFLMHCKNKNIEIVPLDQLIKRQPYA